MPAQFLRRSAAARLEHRYRSTVASGESLRILTDEFVRDSVVADELNEKKEWKKVRASIPESASLASARAHGS